MSKVKPIQQYSIGYNILRSFVTSYLRLFYRKTTIRGVENIPRNKPVILSINHQNALMDALNTLSALKPQPVFMARADIFSTPVVAKILRWLKILPIFRIRDGVKSLQNNDAVFEEAIGVLNDRKILGILPEGNHGDQKRLRILKKGIARIAFQAEERENFELNIQIVPVGLDYTHFINFGGDVLINFGKPFNLSAYKQDYFENEQKGMNRFMQDLRSHMIPYMIHIDDSENYEGIKSLIDLYLMDKIVIHKYKEDHLAKMNLQQKATEAILALKNTDQETFETYTQKGKKVNELIEKLNFRPWILTKERYSIGNILLARLMQFLLFPFYLYGFLTNIIQFQIPVLSSKGIKDPQFLSSIRFVIGMVVFTLMYIVYLILLLVFVPNWIIALVVSATIPLAGIAAFKYYKWFKKTSAKLRYNRLRRKNNANWINMTKNYNDVVGFMNVLMNKA